MRWIDKLSDNIRKGVREWLYKDAAGYSLQIRELMDFESSAIRNRIWYRGDSNELEQLYQQNVEYADQYKFWAAKCTPGMEMRKIHTGLPGLIISTLVSIVLPDMNEFEFESDAHRDMWNHIDSENSFRKNMERYLSDVLVVGDGAFKITFDTSVSEYPILEWYPGDRIDIEYRRGRIHEIVFKTPYKAGNGTYVLHEHYGYGYIENHLYRDEREVPLTAIDATSGIGNTAFGDSGIMLAVPLSIRKSKKYEGRGGSLFDGKLDSFDAFDETWSQWMDAQRAGRARTYIPECYLPRDPHTGEIMPHNAFDNRFIVGETDMAEGARNMINTEQPAIPHDSYLAAYCTSLELCLQGLISPSTLGIDVKKLDNADAQREKEKTTLYTRNSIVEALQETLPKLVSTAVNSVNILLKHPVEDVKVNIPFGEYANPSFESQVETVGKGKTQGIMSIEACVEELYGDTKDTEWKDEEVQRLKAEQGIAEVDQMSAAGDLNTVGLNMAGAAYE